MAREKIDIGTGPNSGDGDNYREAFSKVVNNFDFTSKGGEDAALTVLLNRTTGVNHGDDDGSGNLTDPFASGSINVDLKDLVDPDTDSGAPVVNGFATVYMNLSSNPTINLLNAGTATVEYPNGDTISASNNYYVTLAYRFGKVQVFIPGASTSSGGGDTTAPLISGFSISDANPDRVEFISNEVITATTVAGFTLGGGKTITGVTINTGSTTGHYFTVDVPYTNSDGNDTMAYSGTGSDLADASSNALAAFTATTIANNVAASSYDPSAESGIQLAILSNAALPTDVSGNGNDTVSVGGFTDPSNSGGLNTYDGNLDLIQLTTEHAGANSEPYTICFEIAATTLTPPSSTSYWFVGSNNLSSFAFRPDGNFQIATGSLSDTTIPVANHLTAGVTRIVTLKRDASNVVTLQFDDDAPITLNQGGATNTQPHGTLNFGGNATLTGRQLECQIGRYIKFNEDKTGQDLIDLKQWVADGTP